jgi:hypothetical protein
VCFAYVVKIWKTTTHLLNHPKQFKFNLKQSQRVKTAVCKIIRGYLYMRKVSAKWITRMLDQ